MECPDCGYTWDYDWRARQAAIEIFSLAAASETDKRWSLYEKSCPKCGADKLTYWRERKSVD